MAGIGEFQGWARRQVRVACAAPGSECRVATCVIAGGSKFSQFPGLRNFGSQVKDAIFTFFVNRDFRRMMSRSTLG